MKINLGLGLLGAVLIASLLPGYAFAGKGGSSPRKIDPIVSTDWLADNGGMKNLVILDIRSNDSYKQGHIPKAINVPFAVPTSAWIIMKDGLLLEVPKTTDLFATIGSSGIGKDSSVVVVTAPNPGEPPYYGLANATRVADTLIYAGVKNVAILDGGYPKWAAEHKPITTDPPEVTPVTYQGKVNDAMFVSKEYVHDHLRKDVIIDARDADVYFGVAIEPFAKKAGHIPNARCLPTPWIWNANPENGAYMYKDAKTLGAMASGVIHELRGKGKKAKEVIVYCGVGGYASSWWFVLTQVLGHKNVKFYDGSAQEWVQHYDMVPYQWD